jgi:hypothetical protein
MVYAVFALLPNMPRHINLFTRELSAGALKDQERCAYMTVEKMIGAKENYQKININIKD